MWTGCMWFGMGTNGGFTVNTVMNLRVPYKVGDFKKDSAL